MRGRGAGASDEFIREVDEAVRQYAVDSARYPTFALWSGQRLPTEVEWQMAASWHLNSSTDMMRRFPWGDAMDKEKCNIWCSRICGTVPVNRYPNGAAPNHVLQLMGNVWEWTDSEFSVTDDRGNPIVGEMPMHSIRGGAYARQCPTHSCEGRAACGARDGTFVSAFDASHRFLGRALARLRRFEVDLWRELNVA